MNFPYSLGLSQIYHRKKFRCKIPFFVHYLSFGWLYVQLTKRNKQKWHTS